MWLIKHANSKILYLLLYKLTFYDQKITLDFYTNHTQKPDPSNPRNWHNNSVKSVWKTKFVKPVRIVFEFHYFTVHSLSAKKFEIINFEWLNTNLLELISIVSLDCIEQTIFLMSA